MFYVYVLKSEKTGRFYTGYTENLERRLWEHNTNRAVATRKRGNFVRVYYEVFETLSEAMRRERYFKTGRGRKERDYLIAAQRKEGAY